MTIMTPAPDAMPAEPGTYEHLRPATTRVVVEPGMAADPETDLIVTLGLPHLVRVLQDILDSIDERLGFLEKRADLGRLPMPAHGIDDAEVERYFALYSLLHGSSAALQAACAEAPAEQDEAAPERGEAMAEHYGAAEAG